MERSHPSPSHTADFKCLTSIRVDRFISFIIYQLHKVQKECSLFGWKKWEDIIFRTRPPKKPLPLSLSLYAWLHPSFYLFFSFCFFFSPKANYLFPKMQSIVISSFYEMWWWWRWGEGMPCACMRPRCTFKWCSELSWYYPCVFIISVHPRAFPCVLINAAP